MTQLSAMGVNIDVDTLSNLRKHISQLGRKFQPMKSSADIWTMMKRCLPSEIKVCAVDEASDEEYEYGNEFVDIDAQLGSFQTQEDESDDSNNSNAHGYSAILDETILCGIFASARYVRVGLRSIPHNRSAKAFCRASYGCAFLWQTVVTFIAVIVLATQMSVVACHTDCIEVTRKRDVAPISF